jgi:hypothetical protein
MGRPNEFVKDLTSLINRYGLDNDFGTPDFVLAGYVMECLSAYRAASKAAKELWQEDKTLRELTRESEELGLYEM